MRDGTAGSTRSVPTLRKRLGTGAAYAIAYVVADFVVRPIAPGPAFIAPWYPGAGIAFAAFLFAGAAAFPSLLIARFALIYFASPAHDPSLVAALVETLGSVAAYAIGALPARRAIPLDEPVWRVRDVGVLMAGIAVVAVAGALWSAVASDAGPHSAGTILRFAGGDAIGGFIVVPLLLFVIRPDRRRSSVATDDVFVGSPDERPRRRSGEHMRGGEVVAAALALASALVLARLLQSRGSQELGYAWLAVFVPVLWIAEREGLRGAAFAIALCGLATIFMAATAGSPVSRIGDAQAVFLALAMSALIVGAARTAREEGAARYWNLVASAAEGVWRVGLDGRTLYVNKRMADILGRPQGDMVGRAAIDFIAAEALDAWKEQRAQRSAGTAGAYETKVIRADGSLATVIVSANPVRSVVTGEIVGSVAIVTDVTALRALQSREADAQRLLQAAFRTARDAMILFRAGDGLIVDVNDVWCERTGYRRAEVLGRSQRELNVWADPADSARLAEAVREHGGVRDFEAAFNRRLPGGATERGVALIAAHPVYFGEATYFLIVAHDITAERRADLARAQLRRLEELGRLVGGVAHDFNNLLTVMLAYAETARHKLSPAEQAIADDIGEIERAALRGADLTRRLLAFTRQRSIEPRPIDMNDVVARAGGMLRTIAGSAIDVVVEAEDELPRVMGDPGQVDQVLMNLAVNARDAMPHGGRLRVGTRLVRAQPGQVAEVVGPDALPGDYVELSVADTGTGMDETTRQRAFEPFFTTKPAGEGTGIGLSVVAGIVRQARGAVRIESAPGAGSTFRVYWPVAAMAPVPAETAGDHIEHAAQGQKVLVVEDDVIVRQVICRVLEDAGYHVTGARDANAALDRIAEMSADGGPPHLVLADIVLPVSGGYDLAEQIAQSHPGIPVVLMTGHARWTAPEVIPPNVVGEPLEKPFDVVTLRRAVVEALDKTRR